jgi:hypothetical protein
MKKSIKMNASKDFPRQTDTAKFHVRSSAKHLCDLMCKFEGFKIELTNGTEAFHAIGNAPISAYSSYFRTEKTPH